MQIEIYKLHQILDNCLFSVYFLNAKLYMKYDIKYLENVNFKYAGKYVPDDSLIVIVDHDFYNHELLLCTALHELAHHIQYVNTGKTSHSKVFKDIHASLLTAAFKSDVINPSKLLLSERFLADYDEERRIIKLCENYINANEDSPMYTLEFKERKPRGKNKDEYSYSAKLGKYYRFAEYDRKTGVAK